MARHVRDAQQRRAVAVGGHPLPDPAERTRWQECGRVADRREERDEPADRCSGCPARCRASAERQQGGGEQRGRGGRQGQPDPGRSDPAPRLEPQVTGRNEFGGREGDDGEQGEGQGNRAWQDDERDRRDEVGHEGHDRDKAGNGPEAAGQAQREKWLGKDHRCARGREP
jgi:hypothetical protein